jgi:3-dehydroquinate dehydratase-2
MGRAGMSQRPAAARSGRPVRIMVIHGPNLNLLGKRERHIYGTVTLGEIDRELAREARSLKVEVHAFQSSHEGDIVEMIGRALKRYDGILINPAAYTHTSVAIRDALLAVDVPAVEVHLSNIAKREDFRQHSLTAPACRGTIAGFGPLSYLLGLRALVQLIRERKP